MPVSPATQAAHPFVVPRPRQVAQHALPTSRTCGTATPSTQDDGDAYVLLQGERELMHGTADDLQAARRHTNANGWVLWFRASGVQYVVRDPGLIHRLRTGYARSLQLRAAQERLDARQQALDAQLAAAPEAGTAAPGAPSSKVPPASTQALDAQRHALTEQQAALARKQAGATRLATRQALGVLREALASGRATRVAG
ncbi:hypothetical protein [Xanthomonas campestris]|uniref:hypothetical protein n=1 Tax=Xanthomonas campestris TaxID=339 RepID=UPI001F1D7BE3|nr:hypothetical protein [Xanthomonas campestris]MEA9840160.1 hypothetical protein [Xanthomonas campestris pv. raphani]MEA9933008.1 hypothetical protein [Xanthomonas campestris pv. raphani]